MSRSCRTISNRWRISLRGRVILSGYPHALYQQQLADWYTCPLRARDQSGQHREERLWMNFEPRGELI